MAKHSIRPLIKKEITSSLNSPAPYLAAVFLLVVGAFWFLKISHFAAGDYASFRSFFTLQPILFILLIPVLTMRIWAEENRSGTTELLLTMPYRDWQLILGKFLGTYIIFLVIIALTIPMLLVLSKLGQFDGGQIVTQYIGLLFLGAGSISMGQFVSSLSRNQITAVLISFLVMLLFTLVFEAAAGMDGMPAGLSSVLHYFSLNYHFESFSKGILDTRDVGFFTILTVLSLYLNGRVLTFRKWS